MKPDVYVEYGSSSKLFTLLEIRRLNIDKEFQHINILYFERMPELLYRLKIKDLIILYIKISITKTFEKSKMDCHTALITSPKQRKGLVYRQLHAPDVFI